VQSRLVAVGSLLVVLLVVIVWRGAFGAGFVFDDRVAILRGEASIDALWPPSEWLLGTQRPLVQLSLALNHAFGGVEPSGYHKFNVAAHALAAMALVLVIAESAAVLVRRGRIAASPRRIAAIATAAGVLWALHPVATSTATYVIQRAESMATLFVLLATIGLLRAEEAQAFGRPSRRAQVFSAACVLGAILSKPTAVFAPALLLAVEHAVLGTGVAAAFRARRILHAGAWLSLLSLLATGVVQGVFLGDGRLQGAGVGVAGTDLAGYWAMQVRALAAYGAIVVEPARMSIDHGVEPLAAAWTLPAGVAILAALLAGAVAGFARGGWWAIVPAGILLALAPTSLVPIADPVVDHRLYLPLAFVAIGAVALGVPFARGRALGAAALVAVAAVAVLEARATTARNRLYDEPIRLWDEVIARRPDAVRARVNRAGLLIEAGRDAEAAADLAVVAAAEPGHPLLAMQRGILALREGRAADALADLELAARTYDDDAAAHGALGDAYRALGRPQDAVISYGRAGLRAPGDLRYRFLRANALAEAGDEAKAIEGYEEVATRATGAGLRASALFNLGNTHFRAGRNSEAAAAYRRALEADPTHEGARIWLKEAESRG